MMNVAESVVAVSVDNVDVVVVEVTDVVEPEGGFAPGVSMCPAKTDTESARLRIVAALIRRKVFTLGAS